MSERDADDRLANPRLDANIRQLADGDDRSAFSCGVESLDRYFRTRAGQDRRRHLTTVYVLVDPSTSGRVRGYYTLAAASIKLAALPEAIARGLGRYPDVPAMLLGRLAIARDEQGKWLGERLLIDAVRRTRRLADQAGCALLVVDALDESAARFYRRYSFVDLSTALDASTWPNRLVLPWQTVEHLAKLGMSS